MTYDVTLYFNEVTLLALRLEHLMGVVDHHFILDAGFTFSGLPKATRLDVSLPEIARFRDRFTLVQDESNESIPSTNLPWEADWIREWNQRDRLRLFVLTKVSPEDFLLVCDLDQFPRLEDWPKAVDMAKARGIACLEMVNHAFYLNRTHKVRTTINNARLVSGSLFANPPPARPDMIPSLAKSFAYRISYFHDPSHDVKDCGWHFNNLGGIQSVLDKANATAHARDTGTEQFKSRVASSFKEVSESKTRKISIDGLPLCIQRQVLELKKKGLISP